MTVSRIPLANLSKQYQTIAEAIDSAMRKVIDSTAFVRGPGVKAFEANFAAYSGAAACCGCGNGTDAIYLALQGLGVGHGDEVITVAHTFIGTVEGIRMTGAEPVFIDIVEETMLMDPAMIEPAITPRTKAIVPVHLYGQPCDMTAIRDVAKKHGLVIVEDAAQAHGARWQEGIVGSLGDAAAFSFFPGKNLGAYGDGGAVTGGSQEWIEGVRNHANHGRLDKYTHSTIGINSRLDTLQAVILDVKLRHIDVWNAKRREHAAAYDKFFDEHQINHQHTAAGAEPVYHLYVIRVPAEVRDQTVKRLNEAGIDAAVHYPVPIHRQPAMVGMHGVNVSLPVTDRVADEVISLPVFPEMTEDERQRVMNGVLGALR